VTRSAAAALYTAAYELDLTKFEDEHLVTMACECGYAPALDELWRRYVGVKDRLVHHLVTRAGLQDADRQDLGQEAVFWFLEATSRYDTSESVRDGGCHFRSFLYRVLRARIIDRLRRHYHERRHLPLSQMPKTWQVPGPATAAARECLARHERMVCVQREVDALGQSAQVMWELLVQGKKLRLIAKRLHLSYDAAKRQRRKLLAALKGRLRENLEHVSTR
jgi:RNA polymerase sigma factor (sigma-70 family)